MHISNSNDISGCYYLLLDDSASRINAQEKHYFPQISLTAYTTILSTTSRTVLSQTFLNAADEAKDCTYDFPLYDGVSVVGFTCQIGSRTIKGVVKERNYAREAYVEAISRGETAGLLAQGPTSDVFSTTLGNIPVGEKVLVEVTYIGELKHDMGANGIRFTLPTAISPRYGNVSSKTGRSVPGLESGGLGIIVDVSLDKDSAIKELRSPSHPIAVTIGNTSKGSSESPRLSQASTTLSLISAHLDRDFILEIIHGDAATPRALLETHPTIPNQRALMLTLVPNVVLRPSKPEIIFVVDRSGSMSSKIPTLISATNAFLKSLPIGILFNICSFGSSHSFLWPKSQVYSEDSLAVATEHASKFAADCGGTETLAAVRAAIESHSKGQDLSIILCTDGDIWRQQDLFSYLNEQVSRSEESIRVFPLGIGNAVSHALIEGVARAGNGFAQAVGEDEKLDGKLVRMLGGALSQSMKGFTLEVKYGAAEDDDEDYIFVEKVTDSLRVLSVDDTITQVPEDGKASPSQSTTEVSQDRYKRLPKVAVPKLLQTPHDIPPLYSFARTTVYLLLSPQDSQRTPKVIILRGTSAQVPLEIEIPIELLPQKGETIHQLAARKAAGELEEGRGWIYHARDEDGRLAKDRFVAEFDQIVEREAVRLGVQYQVGGKWCSFVAVDGITTTVQPSVSHNKLPPARVARDYRGGGMQSRIQMASGSAQKCFQKQSASSTVLSIPARYTRTNMI